jgi:hypothetical protein
MEFLAVGHEVAGFLALLIIVFLAPIVWSNTVRISRIDQFLRDKLNGVGGGGKE